MPRFKPTKEQIEQLDRWNSSYRFTNSVQQGIEGKPEVPECLCEIVHTVTGHSWAKGPGINDNAAFTVAMINAAQQHGANPAADDLADENRKLKAQLKSMQEESEVHQDVREKIFETSRKNDYSLLNVAQLIAQFEERGDPVPDGDRRMKSWRSLAIKVLEKLDREKAGLATAPT